MKHICVFCGANSGKGSRYLAVAKELGLQLADRGQTLVYGGGSTGMMGAVADGCIERDGKVIGIIPEYLNRVEVAHPGVDQLITVKDMFERKCEMERISDAFIALPGGFGTFDEIFEVITLAQLNQHNKPVVLLNHNNYFAPLFAQVQLAIREGFIMPEYETLVRSADTIDTLFEQLDKK